jgi:ATP-dependent DNA helicase RecG
VEQSSAMHATSSDEAYYRVGDKSKKLSFDDRMQIMLAKGVQYYEDYPVARATVDDLDLDFVSDYCKRIGYKKDALTFLRTNGDYILVKDGKEQISGAAILLFGKDPQRFFQRAWVRFIRYDGTEEKVGREMNVIKDVIFKGRILDMTRDAIAFVKTQIKEHTYLGPEARFVTEVEYPEFCWTELIVNAIAHRDYSILGTDIQIKMFDDHYTVESPGILPGRVRLNNMRTTHFSRNPKIAAFMKEYEFIREFGEGVDRMYRELEEGGWPKPVFKQDDFMLRASLNAIAIASKKPIEFTENALKNALKNAPKTEAEIISLILDKPSISLDDMASAIQVSRRTVANKIKALQEQGVVIRIGPAKGGQWSVDKENLIHYFAK